MATDIRLSPELLMAQSSEMNKLATEYGSIFTQAKNVLHGMNECWSTNIASNFVSKITLAQNSFSSIVNMLNDGAQAANYAAKTFAAGVGINDSLLMTNPGLGLGTGIEEGIRDIGEWMHEVAGDDKGINEVIRKVWGDVVSKGISGKLPIGTGIPDGILKKTVENGIKIGMHNISGDSKELAELIQSGNATPEKVVEIGEKAAWHLGGSLGEGNAKVMTDVAFKIPGVEEYWKSQGADTSNPTSVLSHAVGNFMSLVTGDESWKDTYSTYDNGTSEGIIGGLKDIGGFIGEKLGFHSAR